MWCERLVQVTTDTCRRLARDRSCPTQQGPARMPQQTLSGRRVGSRELRLHRVAHRHAGGEDYRDPDQLRRREVVYHRHPQRASDDTPADEEMKIDNRSLIAALSWLAGQTRPDLQCGVALAQPRSTARMASPCGPSTSTRPPWLPTTTRLGQSQSLMTPSGDRHGREAIRVALQLFLG